MTNVIDFDSKKKKRIIEVTDEEIALMLEAFFEIPLRPIAVTEGSDMDGEVIGFSAVPGVLENGEGLADKAAKSWNKIYAGMVFDDMAALLLSFMDLYMEQRELAKLPSSVSGK